MISRLFYYCSLHGLVTPSSGRSFLASEVALGASQIEWVPSMVTSRSDLMLPACKSGLCELQRCCCMRTWYLPNVDVEYNVRFQKQERQASSSPSPSTNAVAFSDRGLLCPLGSHCLQPTNYPNTFNTRTVFTLSQFLHSFSYSS